MNDKLIQEIGEIIKEHQKGLPLKPCNSWKDEKIDTVQELFEILITFFNIEEKTKNSPYFDTDMYRNEVKNFAIALSKRIIPEYSHFNGKEFYIHLFEQKYMAYAFFHIIDKDYEEYEIIRDGLRGIDKIYMGLVTFYDTFYGRFADNEEAIRLLCKYYYLHGDEKRTGAMVDDEKIVSVLCSHIRNAGTPIDFGFAFQGIMQIEENIQYLPPYLIEDLLQEYRLYDVLNQKIYRHQIYAIINSSKITKEEKQKLKFFYIDSLMLANIFNLMLQKEWKEDNIELKEHYFSYDEKLKNSRISVFENPIAYWTFESKEERQFIMDEKIKARIALHANEISFHYEGGYEKDIKYDYDDWALESYFSIEMRQTIQELISGVGSQTENQQMAFSLLYLNNYRGITKQILEFDHRFCYNIQDNRIETKKWEEKLTFPFYGQNVYSLSCIVGKNGTGKTSIINFLRETFYKLISIIRDFNIPCEQGYVKKDDYLKFEILDEKADFLVVFRLGEKDYYLTNVEAVTTEIIEPYRKSISPITNEFCKIAYFSQQLRTDQWELYDMEGKEVETERKQVSRDSIANVSRTLQTLGQCDYSELNSYLVGKKSWNIWKKKLAEQSEDSALINREICYQFTLLRNLNINEFCAYMDVPKDSRFHIYSLLSGKKEKNFYQMDCRDDAKFDAMVKEYAKRPDVRIGFFSSGQYAKFTFLAKLYWFLEGYHRDFQRYLKILGRTCFSRDNALQYRERALIFIDEGELYYHPEWQRRFVATLLSMIRKVKSGAKLQIVFTTNSPFIISDILKEDIKYLPNAKEDVEETLGQNIHVLLKNNFYMDYTIGEYSREIIESIIRVLSGTEEENREGGVEISKLFKDAENAYKTIKALIERLGEPVYRDTLKKMLMESEINNVKKEIKIEELERQKRECQEMIDKLKEGDENGTDRTIHG